MRALVIGGSSGIGLSMVLRLCEDSLVERVYVVDKQAFPKDYSSEKVTFVCCDLSQDDLSVFEAIDDIQALYITAGFGKLGFFQELSDEYIHNSFEVNAIAPIRIVRRYYDKLLSGEPFFCAVMVSIAGRVNSPMFSVYSATKAALSKFIEAVNVELDVQGSPNRIMEVSSGSLKGTGFNGGVTQPELTRMLAEEIIERSQRREELFIPQYEDVFKGVIERYRKDAHQFGVESYEYKKRQGRV